MDTLNRAFIGLRFPESLHEQIQRALLLVKRKPGILDMRWNQDGEVLLTLVPLGEVSVATLAKLTSVLEPAIAQVNVFHAEFGGFSGLPNTTQPRFCTLCFNEQYAQALSRLVDYLEKQVQPLIPAREVKPFHPHVLLGRIKSESEPLRSALGRAIRLVEPPEISPISIQCLELLVSGADHKGTHYKCIQSFPLKSA